MLWNDGTYNTLQMVYFSNGTQRILASDYLHLLTLLRSVQCKLKQCIKDNGASGTLLNNGTNSLSS